MFLSGKLLKEPTTAEKSNAALFTFTALSLAFHSNRVFNILGAILANIIMTATSQLKSGQ